MTTDIPTMINRLNATPVVMAIELKRAMNASLILIEADARRYAPRDTGNLANGINSRISGPSLALVGEVGPNVVYGAPVEFGRKVGARMPPVVALIPWVRRHWKAPLVGAQQVLQGFEGEVTATNRRMVGRNVLDRQIQRRAFVLARAISRRGQRRRPYLAEAYNKNRGMVTYLFRQVGVGVAASISGPGGARAL